MFVTFSALRLGTRVYGIIWKSGGAARRALCVRNSPRMNVATLQTRLSGKVTHTKDHKNLG